MSFLWCKNVLDDKFAVPENTETELQIVTDDNK